MKFFQQTFTFVSRKNYEQISNFAVSCYTIKKCITFWRGSLFFFKNTTRKPITEIKRWSVKIIHLSRRSLRLKLFRYYSTRIHNVCSRLLHTLLAINHCTRVQTYLYEFTQQTTERTRPTRERLCRIFILNSLTQGFAASFRIRLLPVRSETGLRIRLHTNIYCVQKFPFPRESRSFRVFSFDKNTTMRIG